VLSICDCFIFTHYTQGDELVFVVSHVNNSITGAVFSQDGAHDHIVEVKLSAETVKTLVVSE